MITAHAIINYSNPQAMRVNGLIKLQLVTIFIDTSSTSTFMDTDTATLLSLLVKSCTPFEVQLADEKVSHC
jgi:hypothetical protein